MLVLLPRIGPERGTCHHPTLAHVLWRLRGPAQPQSSELRHRLFDIHEIRSSLAGLRFHDLRHTCITKLAEGQASEQTLMSIAGHLSRKMLEHYSHIRMAAKRAAVDAIANPVFVPERAQNWAQPRDVAKTTAPNGLI